jgi:DNA-directed RNA polymerase specialized sigma subunit
MIDMRKLMEEYKPNYDIFCEDGELVTRIKEEVQKLSEPDRIIFIMYCEMGSLREVAKKLGVSHTTIFKFIKNIKQRILKDIEYDIRTVND